MRKIRAREKEKGQSFKLYKALEGQVKNVKSRAVAEQLFGEFQKTLQNIEQGDEDILKIGLVGDFYALLWDFPIFDLENYICRLFNVEILPTYSVYDLYFSRKWKTKKEVNQKFSRYMTYWAGGSDTITVRGYIELMDEYQADGIIQLRTFGCIPEEVSSLAIQKINEKEKNSPAFMILSFDDHSNPEGIKTRLEAFCNTLLRRKRALLK
jgi:predicted nucleotide-binding protein (sugar kinase/HSP70/actin superfamily)